MAKHHNVIVKIINNTRFDMRYSASWYDSGRVADYSSWPQTIRSHETIEVHNYERDWALAGCSGYVTYVVDGTDVTIGFSNPSSGSNKLGVGTEGKCVWDHMSSHSYQQFQTFVNTKNTSAAILFYLQCTGGTINRCNVTMETASSNKAVPVECSEGAARYRRCNSEI